MTVTCVPRLPATLATDCGLDHEEPLIGPSVWADTAIELPGTLASAPLHDVFTGRRQELPFAGAAATVPVAELFGTLPFALLTTR